MPDTLPAAFAGLTTARPEEIGLERAALQRLTAAMEREIAAGRAPGVSMLIARHGKVGFAEGLGALRPGGPPMPEDAIFRIYSMTKPIVSVAAMTLVEEGRLLINDPVSKYIPAFAEMKVGVENGEALELVPAKRPITIQDLMRHTSGLTYGFTGGSKVQKLVNAADLRNQERTAAEHVEAIARLPLQHQPGEVWEYSVSTDVLGRIVEIVAGGGLGEVLRERIFAPLGMNDTAFFTPASKLARRAEPFSFELFDTLGISRTDMTAPPRFESGGGGLLSTIGDYARFVAMLSGGGALDGARILGLAHDRIHGERPSGGECRQEPLPAVARSWLRPRLLRADAARPRADGGQRRRIFLGRRRGHGVLDLAARRPVRNHTWCRRPNTANISASCSATSSTRRSCEGPSDAK